MIDEQIKQIKFDKIFYCFKLLGIININFGFLTSQISLLVLAGVSYGWKFFMSWNEDYKLIKLLE